MKTIKKLVSFLLVICMAVSAVPVFAHGPEQEASVAAQSGGIVYYTDPQSAAAVLREGMKNRESTVTIGYQLSASEKDNIRGIANEIEEKAMAHTGVADEGDYLKWHLSEIKWNASGNIRGQTAYYTVIYTMDYNTTMVQEAAVDETVKALLSSLNLQGKSDYEKISAVYEWMCSNIKYDYTHLNDNAYRQQYTAYGALIKKTSVCEGYALLFYRLMLELGIDCRLIAGKADGGTGKYGPHAWNIVKLDEKYYNVDATWDATYYQAYGKYNYFLRCDKNFADHTRDNEYATNAFYVAYPMSASDYKAQQSHTHQTTKVAGYAATCITNGQKTYYTCSCGKWYSDAAATSEITDTSSVVIPATGHTPVTDKAVAATCTTSGKTAGSHCSVCNTVIVAQNTVSATGHTKTTVKGKAATCTESGLTDGVKCSVCNTVLTQQNTIAAAGHSYGQWTQVKAPTIEAEGSEERSCASCGAKESRSVSKLVNSFSDVPNNAYYVNAVAWASSKGITTGTSETTFSPNSNCTRGQIVTFLWRSHGCPEPSSNANPFIDVKEDAYYYKAVLWAVEQGVTSGTSATTFSPNNNCTRGQAVTFMWRAAGKPATASSASNFVDVKSGAFYGDAVAWAVEKGITTGTSATTFSPDGVCIRGQIVTFLYRNEVGA